jgi:hypothetical protein
MDPARFRDVDMSTVMNACCAGDAMQHTSPLPGAAAAGIPRRLHRRSSRETSYRRSRRSARLEEFVLGRPGHHGLRGGGGRGGGTAS